MVVKTNEECRGGARVVRRVWRWRYIGNLPKPASGSYPSQVADPARGPNGVGNKPKCVVLVAKGGRPWAWHMRSADGEHKGRGVSKEAERDVR
jgi:hypothetical protein